MLSRLFDLPLFFHKPKERRFRVVAIGGGTGLSTLLLGLKRLVPEYITDLTAIVTVADNGGSTGRLIRQHEGLPAPGDVRHCILALAEDDALKRLFEYRFKEGKELKGHSVGNILITALVGLEGDFLKAIQTFSRILRIRGEVLPSLTIPVDLVAKFSNGEVIKGEEQISEYGRALKGRIVDIWLVPKQKDRKQPQKLTAPPLVIKRIQKADIIIVGPGSLYTSLIPNFLIENLRKAVFSSAAQKIYISNIMTQFGETYDFSVSDHLEVFKQVIGANIFDLVLVNTGKVSKNILKNYKKEGATLVQYDKDKVYSFVPKVFADNFVGFDKEGHIRHDPYALAKAIKTVIISQRAGSSAG